MPRAPKRSPPASTCSCRRRWRRGPGRRSSSRGEAEAAIEPARLGVEGAAAAGAPAGGVLAQPARPRARRRGGAEEAIEELREAERELDACGSLASATRPAASCASSASAARRAARPRARPDRLADQARARNRGAGHRPEDEQGDRRRALPQREDDRVPPAQHLLQARRLLAGRGRPRLRARARSP